ncbi:MAG: dienelactone hydrolase family protein, partial [Tannerella sp.]|nr:dienelactone hydrolase family protein [Tannerella sp.]
MKKEDVKQEVFDLYDDYAHSRITRLDFIKRLSLYAVGGLTVSSLMSYMMPNYQDNIQVKAGDPRITETYIEYQSPKGGGKIKALLCMPKGNSKKLGGVVVVHENRGLNPHIADVGRRMAVAGFVSLSPDALSPLGGYPGDDDTGREMQSKR